VGREQDRSRQSMREAGRRPCVFSGAAVVRSPLPLLNLLVACYLGLQAGAIAIGRRVNEESALSSSPSCAPIELLQLCGRSPGVFPE
jgi:hypothetical protein